MGARLEGRDSSLFARLPLARDRPLLGYAGGLGICILAFAIRLLAEPWLPSGYPYVSFFPAVILSTFLFGVRPGILVAAVCGVLAWYCFIPPTFSVKMSGGIAFALAFYSVIVALDIWLIDWLQSANRRLDEERERSRALAERGEILFRELQHRVSNNIQMVSGLLMLQRKQISDEDARMALDEASRRLALIGRIHRQLYDPHGERLDLADFLNELSADLLDAAGHAGISCRIEAEAEVELPPQAAVPVALIVAEAVANAIEHGFADREAGTIWIRAARGADGAIELGVIDDGAGLPPGFDLGASESLGLKLSQMLARQVNGSFRLTGGERTTALLSLPA